MKSRFDWNQLDTKLLMWFDKNMWKWKTNRWRIFMAEGCLPAHLSTKTTMIMRRCPSEVSVEASDMGNPECFAHWVLLINFCFSTPGNEFQIKLKVSWNHDEIKVWSVVWAWLEITVSTVGRYKATGGEVMWTKPRAFGHSTCHRLRGLWPPQPR